jgi:hypothetical protein
MHFYFFLRRSLKQSHSDNYPFNTFVMGNQKILTGLAFMESCYNINKLNILFVSHSDYEIMQLARQGCIAGCIKY